MLAVGARSPVQVQRGIGGRPPPAATSISPAQPVVSQQQPSPSHCAAMPLTSRSLIVNSITSIPSSSLISPTKAADISNNANRSCMGGLPVHSFRSVGPPTPGPCAHRPAQTIEGVASEGGFSQSQVRHGFERSPASDGIMRSIDFSTLSSETSRGPPSPGLMVVDISREAHTPVGSQRASNLGALSPNPFRPAARQQRVSPGLRSPQQQLRSSQPPRKVEPRPKTLSPVPKPSQRQRALHAIQLPSTPLSGTATPTESQRASKNLTAALTCESGSADGERGMGECSPAAASIRRLGALWNTTQSVRLPATADLSHLTDEKYMLLDAACVCSVNSAVAQLNSGLIICPQGLCVVYSRSNAAHFMLFRKDKMEAAVAEIPIIISQSGVALTPLDTSQQHGETSSAVSPTERAAQALVYPPTSLAGQVMKHQDEVAGSPCADGHGEADMSSGSRRHSRSLSLIGESQHTGDTETRARSLIRASPLPGVISIDGSDRFVMGGSIEPWTCRDDPEGVDLPSPINLRAPPSTPQKRQSVGNKTPISASAGVVGPGMVRSSDNAKNSPVSIFTPLSTPKNSGQVKSWTTLLSGLGGDPRQPNSPTRPTLGGGAAPAKVSGCDPSPPASPSSRSSPNQHSINNEDVSFHTELVMVGGTQFIRTDQVIGRGAFGVVYKAKNLSGEDVALKVVKAKDAASFATATFEAEVLQMLTLALRTKGTCPKHVPRYFSHCAFRNPPSFATAATGSGGCVRLAMSFVRGVPLDKWLYGISDELHKTVDVAELVNGRIAGGQQGTWMLADAAQLVKDLLSQLCPIFAALDSMAFHRDVSPHNVMLHFPDGNGDGPPVRRTLVSPKELYEAAYACLQGTTVSTVASSSTPPASSDESACGVFPTTEFALIDFGLAVRSGSWDQQWRQSNLAGDPRYWTPAAWMAFAFGFKYVSGHPNKGFMEQYKHRIDHFSVGALALEVLCGLWSQQEAQHTGANLLTDVRSAWARYWAFMVDLFQMFHRQGPQDVRQYLSQSRDAGVNRMVNNLKQVKIALRSAASLGCNARCASLLEVIADLLDEQGACQWSDIPGLLNQQWGVSSIASGAGRGGHRKMRSTGGMADGELPQRVEPEGFVPRHPAGLSLVAVSNVNGPTMVKTVSVSGCSFARCAPVSSCSPVATIPDQLSRSFTHVRNGSFA